MNKNNSLKVFLCHAKEDKPKVRDFYHRLISDGYDAWLDEEKLTPGQDWDFEIQKAVREADIVVVFVSTDSVAKTGYVQKEINFALDAAEMRPEGLIYIIPSRLNECQIPTRLSKWQWVNLYEKNGYLKLRLSLKSQAKILGKIIEPSLDVFEPEMIKIPSGPFLMGSTPEQIQKALQDGALSDWVKNNDEQPQHIVEMPDYFIAKYPVTNKEYQVFIRDIKHHPPLL